MDSRRRTAILAIALAFSLGAARPGSHRKPARRPKAAAPAPAPVQAARDSAGATAPPDDSVGLAWSDSTLSAHGGVPAWRTLRSLRYTCRVTQQGFADAAREQLSERTLRFRPSPVGIRIEPRDGPVSQAVFTASGDSAGAFSAGVRLLDPMARDYPRLQLLLDEFLLRLPWKLTQPEAHVRRAPENQVDGTPLLLLDAEFADSPLLWRIGLDPATRRIVLAMWWHYDRGGIPAEGRFVMQDYTRGGQLLLPSEVVLYDGQGRKVRNVYRYSEFKLDAPAPDSLFLRP